MQNTLGRLCAKMWTSTGAMSHKEQILRLAVVNSCSITVHHFSDLVCQHFFKFELELQLSVSHLLLREDCINKIGDLQLFL